MPQSNNIQEEVLKSINFSLTEIPPYNFIDFVEDAVFIKSVFTSSNKSKQNLIISLNKLRAILRDNTKIFCALFHNLIFNFIKILDSENNFNNLPNECFLLIFDIVKKQKDIKSYYYKDWFVPLLNKLIIIFGFIQETNSMNTYIYHYISLLFNFLINEDKKNINYFVMCFDKHNLVLQKTGAFLFFEQLNKFNKDQFKIVDWDLLFERCNAVINEKEAEKFVNDNLKIEIQKRKEICQQIFRQLLVVFNEKQVNIERVLGDLEKKTLKPFHEVTGYDISNLGNYNYYG